MRGSLDNFEVCSGEQCTLYKALLRHRFSQGGSTAEPEHPSSRMHSWHGPYRENCNPIMPSIPCFIIIFASIFTTQADSRAFHLAEATNVHDLRARQVATSATATASNVGSEVAGNVVSLLAIGASMSSASVEAAAASISAVASNTKAEDSICNADSNRNQAAWIEFDMGDWFKNKCARSLNPLSNAATADCSIGPDTILLTIGTTWMGPLSRTSKN